MAEPNRIKITIQTLKSTKYDLEVAESSTIQEIKSRVERELDLGDAASMKLIHQGKILKDTQTVADAKIKAGDFLVVMVSAKKPAAAPAKAAPAPTPVTAPTPAAPTPAPTASAPAPSSTAAPTPSTSAPAPTPAAPTPAPSSSPPASGGATAATGTSAEADKKAAGGSSYQAAASSLATGDQFGELIANLMGLGFSHSIVLAALRAAFNNPDRAAEYLYSGKTEHELQAMAAAAGAGGPGGGGGGAGGAPSGGAAAGRGAGGAAAGGAAAGGAAGSPGAAMAAMSAAAASGNPMAALAGPEFAQLRTMIQENPQIVPYLLQQLASTNPQLMAALGSNPQAVMQMFGQAMGLAPGGGAAGAAGRGAPSGLPAGGRGAPTGTGGGRGAPSGGLPPGVTAGPGGTIQVSINEEEKAILERLQGMGYSRQKVLEAFIICERNEEKTANYLIEHGMDEFVDFQD